MDAGTTIDYRNCILLEAEWLPFDVELLRAPFGVDKLMAFAILKRGRSKGIPSLKCRDLLASTAKRKFHLTWKGRESHFLSERNIQTVVTMYHALISEIRSSHPATV